MGTGEGGTPTKTSKTSSALQELPITTPSYPEWAAAAAFQAYYGPGATPPPPGYFPSTVASGPQPHPYIWGGQPMIPPYGTPPPPHAALYTYGGIYAHPPGAHPYGQYGLASPSTEMTMAALPASTEVEAKTLEGKDRNTMKKSRGSLGSLGMLTGKGSESAKGTSASPNGHTPSEESGSDGSTEGSDDTAQNGSQHKGTYEQGGVDGMEAYMNPAVENPVNQGATVAAVTGKPVIAGPTTNLNIGMDYWSGSSAVTPAGAFPSPPASAKPPSKRNSSALVSASHNPHHLMGPTTTDLWLQDERELKRQRRKQSNRESARRSRLRKQAECEELTTRVDTLTVENVALRTELNRVLEECKTLSEENATLLERFRKAQGRESGEEERSPEVEGSVVRRKEIQTIFGGQSREQDDDDPRNLNNNRSKEGGTGSYRENDTPSSSLPESNAPHSDAVAAA